MARPTIDDDDLLIAIAVRRLRYPNEPFSKTAHHVKSQAPEMPHSDESFRRRLQRKFNASREHWLRLGEIDLRAQEAERERLAAIERERMKREEAERFQESFHRALELIQSGMPEFEEAKRRFDEMRPEFESKMAYFDSPEAKRQRHLFTELFERQNRYL